MKILIILILLWISIVGVTVIVLSLIWWGRILRNDKYVYINLFRTKTSFLVRWDDKIVGIGFKRGSKLTFINTEKWGVQQKVL